jgi:hypothetical protein
MISEHSAMEICRSRLRRKSLSEIWLGHDMFCEYREFSVA